jgi:hypothetical protein
MDFFKFLFSKLIDRLDNIKKHATGNGSSQCVLCADGFSMLGASAVLCVDCQKVNLIDTFHFVILFILVCM